MAKKFTNEDMSLADCKNSIVMGCIIIYLEDLKLRSQKEKFLPMNLIKTIAQQIGDDGLSTPELRDNFINLTKSLKKQWEPFSIVDSNPNNKQKYGYQGFISSFNLAFQKANGFGQSLDFDPFQH